MAETVTITEQLLNAGKSHRGSWSYDQLRLLGVECPPKRGWRKRIMGQKISAARAAEFVRLCNVHTESAKTPAPSLLTGTDAIQVFYGTIHGDEASIVCPRCEFDYTHIERVGTLLGSDAGEAKIYKGTEQVGTTPDRRSALEIVFSCEGCGGRFAIRICQFKGVNHLRVQRQFKQSRNTVGPGKAKSAPPDQKALDHPAFAYLASPDTMPKFRCAVLSFDGSCANNGSSNATGRWAYTISLDGAEVANDSGPTEAHVVTSNVSEWQGLLNGLRGLAASKLAYEGVLIKGDSKLVIKCLLGEWRSSNPWLTVYRNDCRGILAKLAQPWLAEWAPREENSRCDLLAQ